MADRQQPAELIWTLHIGSPVFQELRGFHELEGDDWQLEVNLRDGTDGRTSWKKIYQDDLRLRVIRKKDD